MRQYNFSPVNVINRSFSNIPSIEAKRWETDNGGINTFQKQNIKDKILLKKVSNYSKNEQQTNIHFEIKNRITKKC